MGKIKNTSQVDTCDDSIKSDIKVHSHWNRSELVVIKIGDESRTVVGHDLKKAIDNCMNVGF